MQNFFINKIIVDKFRTFYLEVSKICLPLCNIFQTMRNLLSELIAFGLTESQATQVLDWTENLPVTCFSNHIRAIIKKGEIRIETYIRPDDPKPGIGFKPHK